MYKIVLSLLLVLCADATSAAGCPDFFRFVDFGQTGSDGIVYRGGNLLRAEGLDGAALLLMARTECLDITDTATDGRGNPIPIVTSIDYNPDKLPENLKQLTVTSMTDTTTAAEKSAGLHSTRLNRSDIEKTQGSNFLCLSEPVKDLLSCQVVSPYSQSAALVVYCDKTQCTMPVLAIDNHIAARAVWLRAESVGNNSLAGTEVAGNVEQIHEFLTPLLSLSPRSLLSR